MIYTFGNRFGNRLADYSPPIRPEPYTSGRTDAILWISYNVQKLKVWFTAKSISSAPDTVKLLLAVAYSNVKQVKNKILVHC